ncbi:MAG: hypothetical protein R3D69_10250 [Xanthobacteraceae bacterium]
MGHETFGRRDDQVERLADGAAGQLLPGAVERGIGVLVGRHMPHAHAGELFEAEVGARVEPQHVHPLFQQFDEGQRQATIEAAFVRSSGATFDVATTTMPIEKPREQPAEDHRVGDIGHMEFVEAQQPRLVEDRARESGSPGRCP